MTESCWVELKEMDSEQLMGTLMEMSLVCLMVERLDIQMVLMMVIDSVQLKEMHLEQMTEKNSVHLKVKPTERRLGCL